MEDYYTIQTPEHHSSLFTQLHALQKQGVMCDVILAAEDGEVMAHKVILMAVSKYFREKLSPVISATATRVFLKGIPVIELANLVKYIYTGKLLIAKETMDITLEVAEILQLNGVINGYKEILAYEQLKGPGPKESNAVSTIKPDKDNTNYSEFNVQVEQFTEEAGANQKLNVNGYPDSAEIETDGSAVGTEPGGSVQTTTHNTSTEYAFETALFQDQYYDVSVGSAVTAQSENQINTMPSLQKMTMSSMTAEENQSQHQDLLSVAIETLTDANYLSSPPGKEARHMYNSLTTQAVSYNTSLSNAETVSVASHPVEPVTTVSSPTDMQTDTTALSQKENVNYTPVSENSIPPANAGAKGGKGNVPVYRVSLPVSLSVNPEPVEQRGRPPVPENEKKKRKRNNSANEEATNTSPTTKSSRGRKLIVSPKLTKSNQKKGETAVKTAESKKLKVAQDTRKANSHLNKVVNELRTKMSEKADDSKANVPDKADDSNAKVSEEVEDFGQSVNFDSDEDDYDDTVSEETGDTGNVAPKSPNASLKQGKEAEQNTPGSKRNNEVKAGVSENNKISQNTELNTSQENTEVDSSKKSTESRLPNEKLTKRKPKKQQLQSDAQVKPQNTEKEENEESDVLKTPEGSFLIEIDNAEENSESVGIKDTRSSASKRKCKAPRRLIADSENSKTKRGLNENIPMVRTRRYSKNEGSQERNTVTNGAATVMKKGINKADINSSKKAKDLEKEKKDSSNSIPVNELVKEKEAKIIKHHLQPVVKLAKQSKEQIMSMAREIAASKSPKKRKLEKVEVEIEQTESNVSVKKKTKKPTELLPVTSLKNRQKTVCIIDDEGGGNDEDNDKNTSKDSIDGTPLQQGVEHKCRKCNKSFRYRMQLNKHSKTCKHMNSSEKKDRNLFDDIQDNIVDGEASPDKEQGRCETPESESCITVEVIQFDTNDEEHLDTVDKTDMGETETGRLYICSEEGCKFSSESSAAAAEHRSFHKVKVKCEDCGNCFPSARDLTDHKCDVICDDFSETSETKKDVTEDKKGHGVDGKKKTTPRLKRQWTCSFCGEVFKTQKEWRQHEKNHDLICSCCNIKFTKIRNYKMHLGTQKRRSVELMCFICNHAFSRRGDQQRHMFKFHGIPMDNDGKKKEVKIFQCELCSFIAWSERTYNLHKKAHTGVKDTPCPTCNKMFMSQYDVNRHVKVVHGGFRDRFKCDHEGCTYKTATKRCLTTHIKLKHEPRQHFLACQFCDHKTLIKGNLDKHIRKIHELEVVTKPVLKDMGKFGELKQGTFVTKEGKEVTEEDVVEYKRRGSDGNRKPTIPKRRKKTIEEFTQQIMARHMKRLESPIADKDYLCPTLQKAIQEPAFPQASVTIRREKLAAKGIIGAPMFRLHYDKMDESEAHQYAVKDEMVGLEQEVIVDDGIVPIPSEGMSVGNEVYIIEAGRSENVVETPEFVQNFVETELEDETTKSLRVLTNSMDNEDETTRSLRVLTTLLEAGQHG